MSTPWKKLKINLHDLQSQKSKNAQRDKGPGGRLRLAGAPRRGGGQAKPRKPAPVVRSARFSIVELGSVWVELEPVLGGGSGVRTRRSSIMVHSPCDVCHCCSR